MYKGRGLGGTQGGHTCMETRTATDMRDIAHVTSTRAMVVMLMMLMMMHALPEHAQAAVS